MQNKLVLPSLNRLAGFMTRFSDKTKDNTFIFACLLLFVQYLLHGCDILAFGYFFYCILELIILGTMLLCSMPDKLKTVRFTTLFTAWMLWGALKFISGITVSSYYIPESVLFLVGFPALFFVWTNSDFEHIFILLVRACIYSFWVYLAACFLFFPISAQYAGVFTNPNGAGQYLCLVFACLIVDVFARPLKESALSIILTGICTALLFYTNSRTGQLSAVASFVVVAVISIIKNGFKNRSFWIKCIMVLLAVTVFCLSLVHIMNLRSLFSLPTYDNSAKVWTSDGKFVENLDEILHVTEIKMSSAGKDLDSYSTGRISIWKEFFYKLNWTGHASTKLYIPELHKWYGTAHNSILQEAYNHGILTGIATLVVYVMSGIYSIVYALKARDNAYAMLSVSIVAAFGVTSQLASQNTSIYYMLLMYYIFMLSPLIMKRA